MTPEEYTMQLKSMKIHDGLLCEFVTKGLYSAALDAIDAACQKRKLEVVYLDDLHQALKKEIAND